MQIRAQTCGHVHRAVLLDLPPDTTVQICMVPSGLPRTTGASALPIRPKWSQKWPHSLSVREGRQRVTYSVSDQPRGPW